MPPSMGSQSQTQLSDRTATTQYFILDREGAGVHSLQAQALRPPGPLALTPSSSPLWQSSGGSKNPTPAPPAAGNWRQAEKRRQSRTQHEPSRETF